MRISEIERRTEILRKAAETLNHATTFAQMCQSMGNHDLAHDVSRQIGEMGVRIEQEAAFLQSKVQEAREKERADFIRRGGYRSARSWS